MTPDPWLHAYVQQYQPVCPLCKVPLHPLVAECPHCRRKIQLGLKILEAYLIAWGLTVCALALEAGIGLILLYVVLIQYHPWDDRNIIYLGIGVCGVLSAFALPFALLFRRFFCRLPHILQWSAVTLSSLLFMLSMLMFFMNLH